MDHLHYLQGAEQSLLKNTYLRTQELRVTVLRIVRHIADATSVTSQRAHDVIMTSYQRRCDVMTSHRRRSDVIMTACACWVYSCNRSLQYCSPILLTTCFCIKRISLRTQISMNTQQSVVTFLLINELTIAFPKQE